MIGRNGIRISKLLIFLLVLLLGVLGGTVATASTNRLDNPSNEPAPQYPKNASGETYGSLADATVSGTEPDLVKALGIDGKTVGYVRYTDLNGPEPKTLKEALAQSAEANVTRRIPLYKEDGKTVIGEFEIEPGNVESVKAEDGQ